jgi:hypothetical protein
VPAWEAAQEKGPNNGCSAHKSAGRGSRVGLQGADMPRCVPCAPRVQGVLGAVAGSEAYLVREHDLCELCLGRCKGQVKGEKCRWRNRIHMELCRENKCRRRHHRLRQREQSPVKRNAAVSVSESTQVDERRFAVQLVAQRVNTPGAGPAWSSGTLAPRRPSSRTKQPRR